MPSLLHDAVPPWAGPVTTPLQQPIASLSRSDAVGTTTIADGRLASRRRCAAGSADAALLERARIGDAAAFAAVYERHAAAALGLARRMVRVQSAAEDVVQESFLALWRTDSYRPEKGSLRTFLLRIVHNRAIDALRRERGWDAREPIDERLADQLSASERTDSEIEQREAAKLVRAVVAGLPEPQRCAVELAYFGGLTHAEIAQGLGEPLGTVKSRIRLGLEKLRVESDPADYL
jgi:RNA polymerase sigma-70 factor (ECF subfamily)